MREQWFIDSKKYDRRVPNSINIKRNGGIMIGKRKLGIVDYYYVNDNTKIKMRHFLHTKIFSLRKDGKISLISQRRGYSIIKKWSTKNNFDVDITADGDIRDILVDNFIACGEKLKI